MNAAVDDAAAMGEAVVRMLATARAKGKMATLDRKRAQMLMVNVAVRAKLIASQILTDVLFALPKPCRQCTVSNIEISARLMLHQQCRQAVRLPVQHVYSMDKDCL